MVCLRMLWLNISIHKRCQWCLKQLLSSIESNIEYSWQKLSGKNNTNNRKLPIYIETYVICKKYTYFNFPG